MNVMTKIPFWFFQNFRVHLRANHSVFFAISRFFLVLSTLDQTFPLAEHSLSVFWLILDKI